MDELEVYLEDYENFQNMNYRIRRSWKDSYDKIQKEIEELEEKLELLKIQAFEIREIGEEKSYSLSKDFDETHEDKFFDFKVRDVVYQLAEKLGVSFDDIIVSLGYLDDESMDGKSFNENQYICLNLNYLNDIYCYFWPLEEDILEYDDYYDINVHASFSSLAKGHRVYESNGGDILRKSIASIYKKKCMERGKQLTK